MFDEQAASAAGVIPAASAAAALTLALNTAGVATSSAAASIAAVPAAVSATVPAAIVAAAATPLAIQHQQQQQQQQQQQLAQLLTGKDSRWLQLEVCREYQRGQCTRTDQDCKYAHPPPHVEVQNGRVTACYDSIKGRCTRENPRCKYLHPPQHLKDQLLANGKQNLVMKNLISQQISHQHQSTMPALAQIVQQPGTPLGLQSPAGLPFPYFIPGLYPGPAGPLALSQADPFAAALQNTFQQFTEHHHLHQHLQAQANGCSANPYLAAKRPKGGPGGDSLLLANGSVGANGTAVNTVAGMSAMAAAAGMPLYATQPFHPYLVPAAQFLPAVTFAGQLPPPRF